MQLPIIAINSIMPNKNTQNVCCSHDVSYGRLAGVLKQSFNISLKWHTKKKERCDFNKWKRRIQVRLGQIEYSEKAASVLKEKEISCVWNSNCCMTIIAFICSIFSEIRSKTRCFSDCQERNVLLRIKLLFYPFATKLDQNGSVLFSPYIHSL